MNNNPFLQQTNRFSFIDSENINKKNTKDKKNKTKYESSNNSFTKPTEHHNKHTDNKQQTNQFKNTTHNIKKHNDEFTITEELFPSLTTIHPNTVTQNNKDFKEALYQTPTETNNNNNTLQPGWIQIYKVNNKITTIYNPNSKQNEPPEDNINNLMHKTITNLEQIWLKHKINYDKIHGEGAYDHIHYMPPIYYDTDSDDDDNNNEEYYETEYNDYETK